MRPLEKLTQKKRDEIWALLPEIDKEVQKICWPKEKVKPCDNSCIYDIWLKSDVEYGLLRFPDLNMGIAKITEAFIKAAGINPYEMPCYFDMKETVKSAMIRRDFKAALENAESGTDLSYPLGFGFSGDDLRNLAIIHRDNEELREKIEDLLTDCNFHPECEAFMEGNYEKWVA